MLNFQKVFEIFLQVFLYIFLQIGNVFHFDFFSLIDFTLCFVMEKCFSRIVLCINIIDRLILDLKLTPDGAYFKLRRIIDDVNVLIQTYSEDPNQILLFPIAENV